MFVGYIPTEPNNLVAMTTKNTNGLSCKDKEPKQQGMTMSVCKHWATAQITDITHCVLAVEATQPCVYTEPQVMTGMVVLLKIDVT